MQHEWTLVKKHAVTSRWWCEECGLIIRIYKNEHPDSEHVKDWLIESMAPDIAIIGNSKDNTLDCEMMQIMNVLDE